MNPNEFSNHNEFFDMDDTNDDMKQLENQLIPSSDYYGILNVAKTATKEEIKDSFDTLCRFFHPDKHKDEKKKQMAEYRFHIIQKAYEVLSDPEKRSLYDTYGEKGLIAGTELGPRYKTTQELREEYEKKARTQKKDDLEELVRSKSEYQLLFDATQILDPYEPPVFAGFGQQPIQPKKKGPLHTLTKGQVRQLVLKQSFQTQLGPQTYAILGGSMVARTGIGSGNILGTIRHTVSPKLWGEVTASLLNPKSLALKSYYTMDSESYIHTTTQIRTMYGPPVLSLTLGRRLASTMTGYMTYRTGEWSLFGWGNESSIDKSSVSLGLSGENKNSHYRSEIKTGILGSRVVGEYVYQLPQQARIHMSCSYSTQGITTTMGSEHKISHYIRAGMALECGSTGVMIKFRISRLGQRAVLPIILSSEFDFKLAFFGAIVPASVAIALDQLILKPRRKRLIQQKIEELREEHAEYLDHRKQEALDAQTLMTDIAERKRKQEEKKEDGLVIVKAWYGHLDQENEEGVIDVTIVIQTLVNESKLVIPGGHSKSSILGFYDPCLGEKKRLCVQYKYHNRLHQVTVEDTEPLISPVEAHTV